MLRHRTYRYIPRQFQKTRRTHTLTASLLILSLVVPVAAYLITPESYAVAGFSWDTNTQFAAGTTSTTTVTEGSILLGHDLTNAVTDTTRDDFRAGNHISDGFQITQSVDHSVHLDTGWFYDELLGTDNQVYGSHLLKDEDLLYVADGNTTLFVVHTQGTTEPTDDIIERYSDYMSLPYANHVFVDEAFDYIYVSSWSGVYVIDRHNTATIADDTLVIRYYTGSTPALPGNQTNMTVKDADTGLLYMSGYVHNGGVSVINTQNTATTTDDVLLTRYHTGSTPALSGNNWIYPGAIVTDDGLLYIPTTQGGLHVIDTQDTIDPGDDTLLTRYHTSSEIPLPNVFINDFTVTEDGLLYINVGHLHVINTQNTSTTTDDELLFVYSGDSDPSISQNYTNLVFVDEANDIVYAGGGRGVSAIHTHGTLDPQDDVEEGPYLLDHLRQDPNSIYVDVENELLYSTYTYSTFKVSSLSEEYRPTGIFLGSPRLIADTPTTTLTYTREVTDDQSVTLQYRTGSSTAAHFNDFNDATTTEYLGDYYAWESPFLSAEESGGTIRLSDPDPYTYISQGVTYAETYSWFDIGLPEEYVEVGSHITARMRVNSDTVVLSNDNFCLFTNDWYDSLCIRSSFANNEWFIVSGLAESVPVARLALYIAYEDGTWDPADSVEIDWIQVTTPDSEGQWNAWSDPCTETTCAIDPVDLEGETWLQYRLNFETEDIETTPSVTGVSYTNGYHATGIYASETRDISNRRTIEGFTAEDTVPVGTAITYTYSTDDGLTWNSMTNPQTFTTPLTPQSFKWRAQFTTDSPTTTPSIESATLLLGTRSSEGGSSIPRRVAQLEAEGKYTEAQELRIAHPALFTKTSDSETQRLEKIISLLKQVVLKLEELEELR